MITARDELYNHLKHLITEYEAKRMIDEYKEEFIKDFKEKLIDEVLSLPPDIVTEINCGSDGKKNRPLIDFAKISKLIREI